MATVRSPGEKRTRETPDLAELQAITATMTATMTAAVVKTARLPPPPAATPPVVAAPPARPRDRSAVRLAALALALLAGGAAGIEALRPGPGNPAARPVAPPPLAVSRIVTPPPQPEPDPPAPAPTVTALPPPAVSRPPAPRRVKSAKRAKRRPAPPASPTAAGTTRTAETASAKTTPGSDPQLDGMVQSMLAGLDRPPEPPAVKPAAKAPPAAELSHEQIQKAMRGGPAMGRACYRQHGQHGVAQMRLQVSRDGDVTSAAVEGPLAGSPTATCLEAAVMGVRFPPSAGVSFRYPFTLH